MTRSTFDFKRLLLLGFPITMVILAIVGGFRWYSASPYWDTWISNIEFLTKVNDGDMQAWWQQHFEHRILITKILTWINYQLFGGFNWFLVVINYALLAAIIALVVKIAREYLSKTQVSQHNQFILYCLIVAWLAQWMQNQSLLWDVCSQILLAQLLPLSALYVLYLAVAQSKQHLFKLAVVLGVAGVFSMANGLLTLPMMALYCVLMRQNYRRAVLLSLLFVLVAALYFHGYESPKNHSSVLNSLIHHTWEVTQYTLHYIGAPFYHLLGDTHIGKLAASAMAILAILLTLPVVLKSVKNAQQNPLLLAMTLYLGYFFASALGVASGRLFFGVDHALWTSRYATSSLIAWSILFIIYYQPVLALLNRWKIHVYLPLGFVALLMLFQQSKVFRAPQKSPYDQSVAVLTAVMNVNDLKALAPIQNSISLLQPIIKKAHQQKISIFGVPPFSEIIENMGAEIKTTPEHACLGALDALEPIDGEPGFVRVKGWMLNQDNTTYPELVKFVSGKIIVGYALTGMTNSSALEHSNGRSPKAGFKGYVKSGVSMTDLKVVASDCQLSP